MVKLKRLFPIIFFTLLMLAMSLYLLSADETKGQIVTFEVESKAGTDKVSLWYDGDGTYYAFFPSFTNLANVKLIVDNNYDIKIDNQRLVNNQNLAQFEYDKKYKMTLKNKDYELLFLCSANVSTIFIDTKTGNTDRIDSNKGKKENISIRVLDKEGALNYEDISFESRIKARGNSTFSQEKKPYQILLSQRANILGMGEASNWILLANAFDESGIRNKLAFELSKYLGLQYSVDSEYVDLYINGIYNGQYLLTEKVEVGLNRVDIKNLSDEIRILNQSPLSTFPLVETSDYKAYDIAYETEDYSGGYLFQIVNSRDEENLINVGDMLFSVSSPDFLSVTEARYLRDLLNQVEDSFKDDSYEQYIDVSSFSKYYLLQELLAQSDNASFYFYKDSDCVDGKVYAGPIWDFDLSLGNVWLNSNINPNVPFCHTWGWFKELLENEAFKQGVNKLYKKYCADGLYDEICGILIDIAEQTDKSFLMNKNRWKESDKSNSSWAGRSQNHFDNLKEHSDYIKDFLLARMDYLNDYLSGETIYHKIVFRDDGIKKSQTIVAIENGERIGIVPKLNDEGQTWCSTTTGEEFDPDKIAYGSEVYKAEYRYSSEQFRGISGKIYKYMSKMKRAWEEYFSLLSFCLLGLLLLLFVYIGVLKKTWRKGENGGREGIKV